MPSSPSADSAESTFYGLSNTQAEEKRAQVAKLQLSLTHFKDSLEQHKRKADSLTNTLASLTESFADVDKFRRHCDQFTLNGIDEESKLAEELHEMEAAIPVKWWNLTQAVRRSKSESRDSWRFCSADLQNELTGIIEDREKALRPFEDAQNAKQKAIDAFNHAFDRETEKLGWSYESRTGSGIATPSMFPAPDKRPNVEELLETLHLEKTRSQESKDCEGSGRSS